MAQGIVIASGGGGGFSPVPPASIITGSGSYTIPAGRYGLLRGITSAGGECGSGRGNSADVFIGYNTDSGGSKQDSSDGGDLWLNEGTNITVFNQSYNYASNQPWGSWSTTSVLPLQRNIIAEIRINGSTALKAIVRFARTHTTGGGFTQTVYSPLSTYSTSSWVLSEFIM